MACSFRWTALFLTTLSVWDGTVVCQNTPGGHKISYQVENSSYEPNISSDGSSNSQLMNTLLTVAAANGVLPDLLPLIQPSLSNVMPSYPQSIKDVPKTLNLIQLSPNQHQSLQEPVNVPSKPLTSVHQLPQPVIATPIPVSSQSYTPVLQTTFTPRLTQPQVCPVSQAHLDNIPSTYLSTGIVQPIPVTWQPQPITNVSPDIWQPHLKVNEISPASPFPTNLHIISPSSTSLETKNTVEIEEVSSANFEDCIQIPNDSYENGGSLPVNLQINLPAQNIPPPQITVVSAVPVSSRSTLENIPPQSPFPPFFQPPIVVDRSDSLKHWLPILMIALFANERDNCGSGCSCCCPCSSNSKTVIPIPYPIPFPINNAIIDRSGSTKAKLPRKLKKTTTEETEDDKDHQ